MATTSDRTEFTAPATDREERFDADRGDRVGDYWLADRLARIADR